VLEIVEQQVPSMQGVGVDRAACLTATSSERAVRA
jgi:hypothetical protein